MSKDLSGDVMRGAQPLADLWRGGRIESRHFGHVVVCDAKGVVAAWGNPEVGIYPRSAAKMIQALPLIESGAAAGFGLAPHHLALACASHQGADVHVRGVQTWLEVIGRGVGDLRCGAHEPFDRAERDRLIRLGQNPCQCHNNCSGKHTGFLSVTAHLRLDPDYVALDHPLQQMIRNATEELGDARVVGHGIDGCSAPNFATGLRSFAQSLASFATAKRGQGARQGAMAQLVEAMILHPDLVAGEGRACSELMRACAGRAALKTGAEGVFAAIVPEKGLGIALKVVDGNSRASEAAIAEVLLKLGLVEAGDPLVEKRRSKVERNWRGLETGALRVAAEFAHWDI